MSNALIIKPRASETQAPFVAMLHGKATDALASMSGRKPEENKLNNTASIISGEVTLTLNNFNKATGTLGVSTHKLLSTAISQFTADNHTGTNKRDLRALKVSLPLKEYAKLCGYDIEPHITDTQTPEEARKEANRAENALKEARKRINKDLNTLFNASISWEEKVKGKGKDYADIRIIGGKGIKNGMIQIEFTASMAEYLIQLPITQYPVALLKLDERKTTAYIIGLKLAEQANIDSNINRGTAELLRVKNLLSLTNLPNIQTLKGSTHNWRDRIKEPFENAMEELVKCGLLEDWEYSHSKGVSLSDTEADFKSYAEWAETLVHFTLAHSLDHTPRLRARAEERKARQERRKRGKKKKEETTDKKE